MSSDDEKLAKARARAHANQLRTMDAELTKRAELIDAMNSVYIESWRDDEFKEYLDEFIANCAAAILGHASRERALFVVGPSGSGKSTLVAHHLATRPEFQRVPAMGDEPAQVPMVSFELKEYAKPHEFATSAMEVLGFETYRSGAETGHEFKDMRTMMIANGSLYLHADEMQHFILAQTPISIKKAQEKVKTMLQWKGWPLHAIFSGTEEMEAFFQLSDQVANRKNIFRTKPLNYDEHAEIVDQIIERIATKHAKLSPVDLIGSEFAHRLMRAANYQFGTTIQTIRHACTIGISDGAKTLTKEHFATAFFRETGFEQRRNHFVSEHWERLPPGKLDTESDAAKLVRGRRR